jgi:ferrous iron transport protein A
MYISLAQLAPNESAEVAGYLPGDAGYRSKLLALGLTKGSRLKMKKLAPLGDPVQIEVRGFNLSLRKYEADMLVLRRDT